jgi:hypothetical protein
MFCEGKTRELLLHTHGIILWKYLGRAGESACISVKERLKCVVCSSEQYWQCISFERPN